MKRLPPVFLEARGIVRDEISGKRISSLGLRRGAITDFEWQAICFYMTLAWRTTNEDSLFLEVGTLRGSTTRGMSQVLKELNIDSKVLTIDKESRCGDVAKLDPSISFFCGTSEEYFKKNQESLVVFAFVDGCHCEECVTSDIESIVPHMVTGSVIAFHDFGGQRALGMKVHERYHGDGVDRLYGVREAVNQQFHNGAMKGFECLEELLPIARPQGSPTPIRGGLGVFQKK